MESSERTTYQHYEVERLPDGSLHELGRGAMGITYKALDSNLRVPVALKVITGALLPDARARARFMREARAAAQLRHSNVATVYHLGQEADFCFYTMEFIDGETCEARVHREGPLAPATALHIGAQVARALQAAHSRGLLHRDLKPSNLMVAHEGGDLLVKVIDFGLVKPLQPDEADAGVSLSGGLFLGTPLYASPEQCASEETIDGRSDLYSLGATLWFLLTGQPLFKGSMRSVMAQHLTKPPPVENLHGQPEAVTVLLHTLLAKDPSERPADAGALRVQIADALRQLQTVQDSVARAAATVPPAVAAAPVISFTMEDVLRKQGSLPPGEVAFLLPRLAALLDHVTAAQPPPDFAPRNVLGQSTSVAAGADVLSILGLPPNAWPPFALKIAATSPAVTLALTSADGTLLEPAGNTPTTPVESLALLVYELLSGSPMPAGRSYRPLTVLTESGNMALQRGLPFGSTPGYAGTKDFCLTLTRALDRHGSTTVSPTTATPETQNTLLDDSEPPTPPQQTVILESPHPKQAGQEASPPPASRKPRPRWLIPVGAAATLLLAAGTLAVWMFSRNQANVPASASMNIPVPSASLTSPIQNPVAEAAASPSPASSMAQVPSAEVNSLQPPQVSFSNPPETSPSAHAKSGDLQRDGATFDVSFFYETLKNDGSWYNTSEYGDVWQPYVAYKSDSWRPYTNGTWLYTSGGWTFFSNESFGWAVYHYGRWTRLKDIGWAWVPGYDWAPAWVTWHENKTDGNGPPPIPVAKRPVPHANENNRVASSPTPAVARAAKSSPQKSSLQDLQRKAIEQQHRSGALNDNDYRQALKGLSH